jgi:hypothetical protein
MIKPYFPLSVIVVLALASVSPPAFAWRDGISSLWPDKPIQIDGRATEWSEFPVVEVGGLSFRARNDSSNLYLLVRGANDDGRILLSGNYRQNVALWFLKPDDKTKAWGITLDFGRAHAPEPVMENGVARVPEIISLSDMGVVPEMVVPQGLEVSTAAFPSGFDFQADLSSERGRQPIYEICIPLTMLEHKGRSIAFDVVSSDIPPGVKTELQSAKPAESTAGQNKSGGTSSGGAPSGGGHGGGRRGRGMGGGGGGGAKSADLPKPVTLHLSVSLAKEPRH